MRGVVTATASRAFTVDDAWVSTPGQELDVQFDALTQAGCIKKLSTHVSGATAI
jgi:hypothetical protein